MGFMLRALNSKCSQFFIRIVKEDNFKSVLSFPLFHHFNVLNLITCCLIAAVSTPKSLVSLIFDLVIKVIQSSPFYSLTSPLLWKLWNLRHLVALSVLHFHLLHQASGLPLVLPFWECSCSMKQAFSVTLHAVFVMPLKWKYSELPISPGLNVRG